MKTVPARVDRLDRTAAVQTVQTESQRLREAA